MIFFADMSQDWASDKTDRTWTPSSSQNVESQNLSDMLEDIEEEIEKEDTKAGKPGRLFLVTLLGLQTLFQQVTVVA